MECVETVESRVAKSVRNKAKTAIKHRKKVEKFLFKSLGAGCRAFESHYSDQNVLIKKSHSRNAARKCGISAFLQKMLAK